MGKNSTCGYFHGFLCDMIRIYFTIVQIICCFRRNLCPSKNLPEPSWNLPGGFWNVLDGKGLNNRGGVLPQVVDPHTVDVDGQKYTAKHILIAVGGRAFVPAMPGSEHVITSDEALDLPSRPNKIVIVGGGYIALEFACIFRGLGSEVHVVMRQNAPLRGFDEEVRSFIHSFIIICLMFYV